MCATTASSSAFLASDSQARRCASWSPCSGGSPSLRDTRCEVRGGWLVPMHRVPQPQPEAIASVPQHRSPIRAIPTATHRRGRGARSRWRASSTRMAPHRRRAGSTAAAGRSRPVHDDDDDEYEPSASDASSDAPSDVPVSSSAAMASKSRSTSTRLITTESASYERAKEASDPG